MPDFFVRMRVGGYREYAVRARGPWDAVEKVQAGHDSVELIEDASYEEVDPRSIVREDRK